MAAQSSPKHQARSNKQINPTPNQAQLIRRVIKFRGRKTKTADKNQLPSNNNIKITANSIV